MEAVCKLIEELAPLNLIFRGPRQHADQLGRHHQEAVGVAQGVVDQLGWIAGDVAGKRMDAAVRVAVERLQGEVSVGVELSDYGRGSIRCGFQSL